MAIDPSIHELVTAIGSRIRRLGRFDALVLTALIWFLAKFLRYAFPPLFDSLQGMYGVSNTIIGGAYTGFMVVYALMQFPSGALADRLGSVKVIVGGALLAAGGAFVVVFEPPFAVLVCAMVIMGAGTGAHKTVAIRLLSRAYPSRTGRALGVLDTVGTFGGVAAPAAVVAVASVPVLFDPGWRTLFLATGLASVSLAVLFAVRVPKRLPEESGGVSADQRATLDVRRYVVLFREWQFTAFVVVTLLFSFAYNGVVAFVPLYLTQAAGLAEVTASALYGVLFAISVVQLVTGEVSDRVGSLPVIVFSLCLATVGLISFVLLTGTGSALALGGALVAVGIGSHGFRPVRGSYLVSVIPPSITGGSLGVVRTMLMGAGAISPVIVGYLSEIVGFRAAFAVLGASVAGAAVLSVVLSVAGPEPSSSTDR